MTAPPPHLIPTRPASPPAPHPHWALFLDLDGTLLDIAPTPNRVVVPDDLIHDLRSAADALGGALAIVSGRTLRDVDTLLSPFRPAAGGEHGAIVRLPGGEIDAIATKAPSAWADALETAAESRPGTFVERKTHSVVVHYRRAAQHEDYYRGLCAALVADRADAFEVLQAKLAVEIRPRDASKGRAVERFMAEAPFAGRKPVFVGDDATDHDGFRVAEAMGGDAYDVLDFFGGRPKEVRRWLKAVAAVSNGGSRCTV